MPEVLIKFLDWPFLLFLLLIIFGYNFQDNIRTLFTRGEITIGWGKDRTITLKDLSKNLDKELEPLQDEVNALREMVEKLQAASSTERKSGLAPASGTDEAIAKGGLGVLSIDEDETKTLEPQKDEQASISKMVAILASGDLDWRSLKALAAKVGIPEDYAIRLLRQDHRVELETGKSGNRIAKLKDR